MHEVTKDVKLKGKVVETIQVQVFESVNDAVETLTDEKVLDLVNNQHRANTMNACRAKYSETKAGKKKLRAMAFALCAEDKNPENYTKMCSLMGDFDAMQAFLDSLIPEVQATLDAEAE